MHISRPNAIAILLALVLSVAGGAQAQQSTDAEALQAEVQALQQALTEIQNVAVNNAPELQRQASHLQSLVRVTMEDAGFDLDGMVARFGELQAEFDAPALSDQRRSAILAEAREIQADLQQGQQLAMQDPQVLEAQQRYESDLLAAMRRANPETDAMLDRFDELRSGLEQSFQVQ
jgi:pyruvate/2-oxoglutarate dehydrogenase complex dihydrolipoamide acyltransferase (E2) component